MIEFRSLDLLSICSISNFSLFCKLSILLLNLIIKKIGFQINTDKIYTDNWS